MINPDRKELLYNYSLIMFDQGKYKEALSYLQGF
jgi:hypothetical protein